MKEGSDYADQAPYWTGTLVVMALSQVLSILGFNFVTPFLPLFVQQLGVHGIAQVTLWAGILSGGSAICMAFAAPIWGVLADRYGRKIMVTRAAFSAALFIGLMAVAQNVYQLLALRMLQGIFTGTVSASQALIAAQTPRRRLGFSMGVMQTAVFVGTSVGPLMGGLVADAVGFRRSFAVGALALFLSGLVVVLFVKEEERFGQQVETPRPRLWQGMAESLKAPALRPMIAAIFCVQFGTTVVFPILPQFVQYLQGPADHAATVTGLIFAGGGLAGAISSVSIGFFSDRVGYKSVLVTSSALAAALSIPQYFVEATWQLFVLRVLLGLAMGAVLPAASALIATLVPAQQRGTAYGLAGSATSIGFGAGPLTAAAVVNVSGIRTVFLTAAVLFGFIAFWMGALVRVPAGPEPISPVPAAGETEERDLPARV